MLNYEQATENTIGARLNSRENNFDALRLVAAFAVIFSHAYPIRDGGRESEPYWRLSGYCTFGEIAVAIFFVVSGLLVARSFVFDPHVGSFLKKRLLRILPGLIACVAFCIFIVGPVFTTYTLKAYFRDPDLLRFARNALLLPARFDLPGVFERYSLADPRSAVNGSLWSLPLEFLMYLGVLALGMTGLLKRKGCLVLVAGVLILQWLVVERIGFAPGTILFKYRVWFEQMPHLGFLFFGGTLMLLFKDSIVLDWRWFMACVAVIALSWQGTFETALKAIGHPELIGHVTTQPPHGYFIFSVCLPYMVMYLAFLRVPLLKPVLQSMTKWGDFSYGVYLYGFPVEQMLFRTWGDKLPFPAFIGLACVGTLILAVLSWHLVEKPFLKFKKRSTRGQRHGADVDRLKVDTSAVEMPPARPPVSMQRQYSIMRQVIFFV